MQERSLEWPDKLKMEIWGKDWMAELRWWWIALSGDEYVPMKCPTYIKRKNVEINCCKNRTMKTMEGFSVTYIMELVEVKTQTSRVERKLI